MSHTPGPWLWLYRRAATTTDNPSCGMVIGLPWVEYKGGCGYENIDDVKLMASAPELLAERDALKAEVLRLKTLLNEALPVFCSNTCPHDMNYGGVKYHDSDCADIRRTLGQDVGKDGRIAEGQLGTQKGDLK